MTLLRSQSLPTSDIPTPTRPFLTIVPHPMSLLEPFLFKYPCCGKANLLASTSQMFGIIGIHYHTLPLPFTQPVHIPVLFFFFPFGGLPFFIVYVWQALYHWVKYPQSLFLVIFLNMFFTVGGRGAPYIRRENLQDVGFSHCSELQKLTLRYQACQQVPFPIEPSIPFALLFIFCSPGCLSIHNNLPAFKRTTYLF